MSESTEVVESKPAGAIAIGDFGEDAGSGFENQTAADRTIGYLGVLQSNSPQVEEGLMKNGNLLNTATDEEYDGEEGVPFLICTTQRVYSQWNSRNSAQSGLVARHAPDSQFVIDAIAAAKAEGRDVYGKIELEDGTELQETFYAYGVLCVEDTEPEAMIVSFASTKIKAYKAAMSRINKFLWVQDDGSKVKPPLFSHLLRISTVKQKNDKGSFNNFVVRPLNEDVRSSIIFASDPRYQAAKALKAAVEGGEVKAKEEKKDSGDTPF